MPKTKAKAKARALLSKHLVLNSFMCDLFGMKSFKDFKELLNPRNMQGVPEGFDEEGRSFIFYALKAHSQSIKISIDKLEEYDANIRGYVKHIAERRDRPIKLKYFQYLAVLFTEIYLDKFFSDPTKFLRDLNGYASSLEGNEFFFSRGDLRKLAFWMATGSGKTLLLHINFLQFMRYNHGVHALDFDNILLITPSETLSNQHINEMRLSNVNCGMWNDLNRGYFSDSLGKNVVKVLDIHKFTEEKKGSGVTVGIEEFGNKNLVFVDEGHKGSGGTRWRSFREFVAQEGFTFEYSATFGQAIATATKNAEKSGLLEEYSKCILFDYSYRYFYNDGYGKDYRILNLKQSVYSDAGDTLLLANALTFYEQKLLFDNPPSRLNLKDYNIEPPLWIFVGSKVRGKKEESDILKVVQFLDRLLKNEDNWAVETIQHILDGHSNLLDDQDRDLFSHDYPEKKLQYLRDQDGLTANSIYEDMLKRVFYVSGPAPLHLVNLKGIEGEIGLKAGASEDYFGVINIGDVRSFLKLAEKKGFNYFEHELARSLFNDIESPSSLVNVLVGAKKFIEGWNSWRVSNMGLLNIGKKEGSQIIQLFGRGIRLRGKEFSLKRSSAFEGSPPQYLQILETLNIFGLEANYMEQFREHLRDEGIDDDMLEIPLEIKIEDDFLDKGLVVPKMDIPRFKDDDLFVITGDEDISISVDLNPKVETLNSLDENGIRTMRDNRPSSINKEFLASLNWESIYFRLIEYRFERGWNNMAISIDVLQKIMGRDCYTLYCPKNFVSPSKFEELSLTEDVVISVLKKYLREIYNKHRRLWGQKNVEIAELTRDNDNLNFEKFTLKVEESKPFVLAEVKQLVKDKLNEIRGGDFSGNYISNVYFDRHLYQPLLVESAKVSISPSGLNDGEKLFVEDLKRFYLNNPSLFDGKEVFLLRNLPKRGVGFYENSSFFPDFIIWVKSGEKQNLIFVDPHGTTHMYPGLEDEKILLAERIKDIEMSLHKISGGEHLYLDSFIISVSPYQEVKGRFGDKPKDILEKKHLLFQHDDSHYIDKIFRVIENT